LIFEGGKKLSNSEEAVKLEIELMEKEILYFTGRKRAKAKRKYIRLLKTCKELQNPIYLKRR
jgi:hypothetical protein